MTVRSRYWDLRFADWPDPTPAEPGYTLLLPVPGDLPVFLELALAVTHRQRHEHRRETIVVPDQVTPAVSHLVDRWSQDWNGPLILRPFPMPERRLLPRMNNPFRNYGVQFITGVSVSRASHVILHDADLFLLDDDYLDRHYSTAVERGLYASGVSPVWDGWFAERGHQLTATWELCVERSWARSFPPHLHMGHEAELMGERHVFDVTLRPQVLSDPARIGIGIGDDSVAHFNHVIATYRRFVTAPRPFSDHDFRLLLIAIFVALFAEEPYDYALPPVEQLRAGLGQGGEAASPVRYPPREVVGTGYHDFRTKLDRILGLPWLGAELGRVQDVLSDFDEYYEWSRP